MLTCAQRGGVEAEPAVVEPAVAPAPPVAVPMEVADVQEATGVAVDSAPEEHVLAFPFLGNEVRIGEQVVENVGVQDWLARKFLAEFVSPDAILFLGGGEVERVGLPSDVPFELAAFMVFLDPPTIWHERIGVAVDDVFHHRDGRVTEDHPTDIGKDIALAEPFDFLVSPVPTAKRRFEFASLINVEHEIAHGCISFFATVFKMNCVAC